MCMIYIPTLRCRARGPGWSMCWPSSMRGNCAFMAKRRDSPGRWSPGRTSDFPGAFVSTRTSGAAMSGSTRNTWRIRPAGGIPEGLVSPAVRRSSRRLVPGSANGRRRFTGAVFSSSTGSIRTIAVLPRGSAASGRRRCGRSRCFRRCTTATISSRATSFSGRSRRGSSK